MTGDVVDGIADHAVRPSASGLIPADATTESISASDANRSFSALLRRVRQGKSFTVQSHGRPVAIIRPVESEQLGLAVPRRALLNRLLNQPCSGPQRSWRRDELYD